MTSAWILILYLSSGAGNSSTAAATTAGYFDSEQQCEAALSKADDRLPYSVDGVCVQGVKP